MRYRKLGRSGLIVSELCLGTNTFGGGDLEFWKELGGLDQQAVNAVMGTAVEGGINFIDTADGYSAGQSEIAIGRAIRELELDRSGLVICTKAGLRMGPGPNNEGNSRAHLMRACEASLRRLDTDYIDLYLLHMFDPAVPLEETLRALDDLVRDGKVRYVGCSNFAAWEIMKARGISDREQLARLEVVQSHWSIASRGIERDIVPLARSEGVGIMAWAPLLGGVLTGKYQRDGSSATPGRRGGRVAPMLGHDRVHDIVDAMRGIAENHGVTPAEIALAFLLRERAATSLLVGATRPEQVAANLRAVEVELTEEEYAHLNELSALVPDYGTAAVAPAREARAQYLG
ncbi:aldo/keto reductase [Haliea sp. E17]|uniref:aldo/keto reductase n=1 Tax=Haliea sp. E17 TaxID=3401576 RepID=UPI003AAC69BA